jgi:hypothetical protein
VFIQTPANWWGSVSKLREEEDPPCPDVKNNLFFITSSLIAYIFLILSGCYGSSTSFPEWKASKQPFISLIIRSEDPYHDEVTE